MHRAQGNPKVKCSFRTGNTGTSNIHVHVITTPRSEDLRGGSVNGTRRKAVCEKGWEIGRNTRSKYSYYSPE